MTEIQVPLFVIFFKPMSALVAENRRRFDEAGIFVVNLMSSPGAGKDFTA